MLKKIRVKRLEKKIRKNLTMTTEIVYDLEKLEVYEANFLKRKYDKVADCFYKLYRLTGLKPYGFDSVYWRKQAIMLSAEIRSLFRTDSDARVPLIR